MGAIVSVGFPWDGLHLTGDSPPQILLPAPHPAGIYWISLSELVERTILGANSHRIFATFNDGNESVIFPVMNFVVGGSNPTINWLIGQSGARYMTGNVTFYSSGRSPISCYNGVGAYVGGPIFTIYARLFSLGA
jgi:hypothetical protein